MVDNVVIGSEQNCHLVQDRCFQYVHVNLQYKFTIMNLPTIHLDMILKADVLDTSEPAFQTLVEK